MHWIYAHLIGDYILQNDWMAQHKKVKSINCLVHVITYMIPFLFCNMALWQLLLIGIQHYYIDRTNFVVWFMKKKGSGIFASNVCFPWSVIVIDNIIHILWMAFVVWSPALLLKMGI